MTIQYTDYSSASELHKTEVLDLDCEIPGWYDPYFTNDIQVREQRLKYYANVLEAGFFKLALNGEKLVGFHAILLKEDPKGKYGSIGTFWVHSDYRKQGIGRRLKQLGEEWARANDCAFIQTGVHIVNERMLEINREAGYTLHSVNMRKYFRDQK